MKENQGFIRGHRAESGIIDWSDCKLKKEEIDEVVKPFISKGFELKEKGIYVSSSNRWNRDFISKINAKEVNKYESL